MGATLALPAAVDALRWELNANYSWRLAFDKANNSFNPEADHNRWLRFELSSVYHSQFMAVMDSCRTVAIDTQTKYGTCAAATHR